jgi:hypothetical protein
MLWNKLIQLFLGSSLVVSPSLPAPSQSQASMEELLSYECAKSVATMLYPAEQPGPVYSADGLVFTSIEASDYSQMLIVTAGKGTFAIPLNQPGLNRVRFKIFSPSSKQPTEFFLSFLHDSVTRSRVFDFAARRPPVGKVALDYTAVSPQRAEALLPNLEYKIHETVESMLASLAEGRLMRAQVRRQKADNCEHIARKSPALGRILNRNLNVVERIVIGPMSKPKRSIASVSTPSKP